MVWVLRRASAPSPGRRSVRGGAPTLPGRLGVCAQGETPVRLATEKNLCR
jgi:hypothetical protein